MAAATKKPRKKRATQGHLNGMEPESIPALDDAAENYFDTMQKRVKLSKEDETKTALIEAMKEHGLDRYETSYGRIVTMTSKSNVKCKTKEEAEAENLGEE